MRIKNVFFLVLLLLFLLIFNSQATAEDVANESEFSLKDTMENLDIDFLENYKNNLDDEIAGYIECRSVKDWLLDFIKGDWNLDLGEVGQGIIRILFKEIVANSSLLGKLLILAVLAALLINLQEAFSSDVSRISYLACCLALCAIAVGSFNIVLDIGINTLDNMVSFMIGMLPQMLVLTAGLGNVNASVMLFPVLMTAATAIASTIKTVVFPLIIMSAILSIVNNMSESIKVARLGKFFSDMAKISLGFFLTIFVGIITARSLYASVLDRITLRTTKYVSDNAIPVIGKMFSDTIEVAAGYIVMLKQALGVFGVIIILGIVTLPLIKIAAIALIYKAASAVAEPLGDSRTAAILESMSNHLFLMLAAVISVALMFFIMFAIVAGMYNGWAMLH